MTQINMMEMIILCIVGGIVLLVPIVGLVVFFAIMLTKKDRSSRV